MANDQNLHSIYTHSRNEYEKPMDEASYRTMVADVTQQFNHEFPKAAETTFILDPTKPTEPQLDAFLERVNDTRVAKIPPLPPLSNEETQKICTELTQTQDDYYKGLINYTTLAETSNFEVGKDSFHVMIPTPRTVTGGPYIRANLVHELNHVATGHPEEGDDFTPKAVSLERRAVLSEYLDIYANTPNKTEALERIKLAQSGRVAWTGWRDNPDLNYLYIVPDNQLTEALHDMDVRTQKGEKSSLAMTYDIAGKVIDAHLPTQVEMDKDLADIKSVQQLRESSAKANPDMDPGIAYHEALGKSSSPWAKKIFDAQNSMDGLEKYFNPDNYQLMATTGSLDTNGQLKNRNPMGIRNVDMFDDVSNTDVGLPNGDFELIGSRTDATTKKHEGVVGLNLDHNGDTGQGNGYDAYLITGEDGSIKLHKGDINQKAEEVTIAQSGSQEAMAFNRAAKNLEGRNYIANVDLNQIKAAAAALVSSQVVTDKIHYDASASQAPANVIPIAGTSQTASQAR